MYALFTAIPLIGHLNPLLRQAEELRRRGWRVAIASPSEMRNHVVSEAPDLPFVDLGSLGAIADSLRRDQEAASIDPRFSRGTVRIVQGLMAVWPLMFDGLTKAVSQDRPDVMVVDLFSIAGLAVAEASRIPVVVNNADLLASVPVTMLPPADWTPFLFSGRSIRDVPWYQRLTGPFVRRFAALLIACTFDRQQNILLRSRKLPSASFHDLLRDKPILVNGVFGLEYRRPLPALFEMVGPMLPASVPNLTAELSQWLSDGPPVVYANLGTLAVAPEGQLAKMAEAFDTDKFRVLWVLKQSARLRTQPQENVRVLDWGPTPLSVLLHPNVKVYVSHCGINSAHESMYSGTPIVGIPMFADQRDMAARIADAGAGLWLDKMRFSAADLRGAIERVLEDASFARNICEVQAAISQSGGVQRAADIIEKTITHYLIA